MQLLVRDYKIYIIDEVHYAFKVERLMHYENVGRGRQKNVVFILSTDRAAQDSLTIISRTQRLILTN